MELENGKYKAKAKSWLLAQVGEKETPEIAVEFELVDEAVKGKLITWDGWLTDGAYARTVESLRTCGWKGEDVLNIQALDNEVELVIENEEYNGNWYPRVKWVNRIGGLSVKTPMQGDKAKAFAAAMAQRIRGLEATAGKKPAAAPKNGTPMPPSGPPEPPPITDADLPF